MQSSNILHSRSRLLLVVAALSLLAVYVFPIWNVTLEAPQYPEGIGMEIWVHTVKGQGQHDLQNINGLNHYIGMKPINPNTIPELRYMPWIFAALIALGIGAAALNKPWALYTWVVLFLIAAATGLIDFYIWEYNYGHDLNPDAAIKIPGMAYQPPLLGSKQMLNITAHSWPALGGIVAFLAGGVGIGLAVFEWWRGRSTNEKSEETTTGSAKKYQVA